jgi:hypothetical protein
MENVRILREDEAGKIQSPGKLRAVKRGLSVETAILEPGNAFERRIIKTSPGKEMSLSEAGMITEPHQ